MIQSRIHDKVPYLKKFIELSSNWLQRDCAKTERDYLYDRINKDDAAIWDFGYMPGGGEDLVSFMDEYGMGLDMDPYRVLEELGIVYRYYKKTRSFFHDNTLLIPFHDVYGRPISISGRTMSNKEQQKKNNINKYKHLPFDKKNHLYGLNKTYKAIIRKDEVVVVEGQFDCMSGFNYGIDNIVALCGSKFTFEQIMLLKRFTNNISTIFDNDEAGDKGYEKTEKQSEKYKFNLNRKILDGANDLDEYLKAKRQDNHDFFTKSCHSEFKTDELIIHL